MSAVVFKHTIPVDDMSHPVPWRDGAVVTAVRVRPDDARLVNVWVHYPDRAAFERDLVALRVVGTGQSFSEHAVVVGTTVHEQTGLVWHVIREDAR